ncbi:SdpI family protein [Streptomyces sp. NBC_00237]|uniref:SdpI family protein n=1 Tax=Streptomyces sp. NBC_00237 TaxID=2975687 RepID=UPI0022535CB3|nr:SdpI family protein [Streptomyces sp. NBC_00237]MCX5205343.1 SdpI family protein [Streptomyces sp. NBC_00237]
MEPVAVWVCGAGLLTLGLLIHFLCRQAGNGDLGRNAAIGIRTRATMSSDAAWNAGHAAAIPLLRATYLTAYATGAITGVLALAVPLGGIRAPAIIAVPLCALATVVMLLSVASSRANAAARTTA